MSHCYLLVTQTDSSTQPENGRTTLSPTASRGALRAGEERAVLLAPALDHGDELPGFVAVRAQVGRQPLLGRRLLLLCARARRGRRGRGRSILRKAPRPPVMCQAARRPGVGREGRAPGREGSVGASAPSGPPLPAGSPRASSGAAAACACAYRSPTWKSGVVRGDGPP